MSKLLSLLGIERIPVTHTERLVATGGAFVGIYALFLCGSVFLPPDAVLMMTASMGASAVLLFAVPHGPLSQPWALIGGHLISAAVGVTVMKIVPDPAAAGALAVALAVTAMHYGRCIHPPGGATALAAVIGGPAVHHLGYMYLVTPVLLNVLVLLGVTIAYNALFAWRRYPAALHRTPALPHAPLPARISHDDFMRALRQMDLFIDISEEEFLEICSRATQPPPVTPDR